MSSSASNDQQRGAPIPAWTPNAISVLRIALVPVFIWLASGCQELAREGRPDLVPRSWAVAVLAAIGLSDLLDGFLARRFALATPLGASLDALADKVAQVGLLLFFAIDRGPGFGRVPAWFVALIVARDLWMAAGWLILRRRRGRVHVDHRFHGRFSSVLVFLLLLWITSGLATGLLQPGFWLTSAVVVASTASYTRDGFAQLRASQASG